MKQYVLNCYRKGYYVRFYKDMNGPDREYVIISVWTVSKKFCYLVVENIASGDYCALRLKTLLEAAIKFQEADQLLQKDFKIWGEASEKAYKLAKPRYLKYAITAKNCMRLATPDGLLRFNRSGSAMGRFMKVLLGRYENPQA
jgi:hypothetical protein